MKIARVLLMFSVFSLPWLVNVQTPGGSETAAIAFAAPPDGAPGAPKVPDVDVNINRETTEKHVISFQNPVVVVAAIAGLVLIIGLIAMVSRGGGTTIIKE